MGPAERGIEKGEGKGIEGVEGQSMACGGSRWLRVGRPGACRRPLLPSAFEEGPRQARVIDSRFPREGLALRQIPDCARRKTHNIFIQIVNFEDHLPKLKLVRVLLLDMPHDMLPCGKPMSLKIWSARRFA